MAMLQGYCDASFGGNIIERKSPTGVELYYDGGPVFWGSKRQALMAMSTVEAEYIALESSVQHTLVQHQQVLKTICFLSVLLANESCYLKTDNHALCHAGQTVWH